MKRLNRALFIIFGVGVIASLLWIAVRHNVRAATPQSNLYDIQSFVLEDVTHTTPPELPDVSEYTLENVLAKMPEEFNGRAARVGPLEKSFEYKKIKLQAFIPKYAELQGRFQALGIEVLGGDFDLEGLANIINNPEFIEKKDDHYLVHVPLLIGDKATLTIQGQENKLRMSADTGAFISNFGNLFVVDSVVEGWRVEKDDYATFLEPRDFRPYIMSWCGAEMYLANSEFYHLGYHAPRAYGVNYTSCTTNVTRTYGDLPAPTGWVINSYFEDIYYGFYSHKAEDVAIINNVYANNVVYGIDPHDFSKRLIIAYNTAYGSKKKHGIIVSREVNDSWIFNNRSFNNKGSGIMIDRQSRNNVIAYNKAYDNEGDGLTIYESPDNLSYKNTLINNKDSGIRIRNSLNFISRFDVVNHNQNSGIQGYSVDLILDGLKRNLEMDPYEQRTSFDIAHSEIVGNGDSQFNFANIEKARFSNLKIFQSPDKLFGGDLRRANLQFHDGLYSGTQGVEVVQKGLLTQ